MHQLNVNWLNKLGWNWQKMPLVQWIDKFIFCWEQKKLILLLSAWLYMFNSYPRSPIIRLVMLNGCCGNSKWSKCCKKLSARAFLLTVITHWPMRCWKWVNWPIRGQYWGHVTSLNQSETSIQANWPISDLGAVKLILLLQRPWQQSLKRNWSDHLEQGTSFVLLSSQQKRHQPDICYSEVVSH